MRPTNTQFVTAGVYVSEASIRVNGVPHKAMADQLRTVAKALGEYIGTITGADMRLVEQAIRRQLGLLNPRGAVAPP